MFSKKRVRLNWVTQDSRIEKSNHVAITITSSKTNDLKTLTQSQKEEKEAVQRAIEEENQRLKEAGFRQTDPSLILQLTMKCTPLELIVLIKPYYGIVLMGQSQHLNLI